MIVESRMGTVEDVCVGSGCDGFMPACAFSYIFTLPSCSTNNLASSIPRGNWCGRQPVVCVRNRFMSANGFCPAEARIAPLLMPCFIGLLGRRVVFSVQ